MLSLISLKSPADTRGKFKRYSTPVQPTCERYYAKRSDANLNRVPTTEARSSTYVIFPLPLLFLLLWDGQNGSSSSPPLLSTNLLSNVTPTTEHTGPNFGIFFLLKKKKKRPSPCYLLFLALVGFVFSCHEMKGSCNGWS